MQNYRAKYAQFIPESTEVKLADGSDALLFNDIQPADDYGTGLNCPVYGYGLSCDSVPFIVAYIVMDESAVDDAKCTEMKGYVETPFGRHSKLANISDKTPAFIEGRRCF